MRRRRDKDCEAALVKGSVPEKCPIPFSFVYDEIITSSHLASSESGNRGKPDVHLKIALLSLYTL